VEGTFTDFFGDQFHSTAGIALVTLVLDGLLPLLLRRLVWCGNGWGLAVDLREVGPCLGRDEAGVVRAFSCDVPALTAYLAWVVENDGLTVEVWDLRGLVGAISLNMTLSLSLCAIVVIVVVAFLAAVFGIVISHVAVGAVLAASVILLAICVSLPVATITVFITVVLALVVIALLSGMAVPLTVFAVLLLAAVVTTNLLPATSTTAVLLTTAASTTASFTASHF
jgi:hypothetical protein